MSVAVFNMAIRSVILIAALAFLAVSRAYPAEDVDKSQTGAEQVADAKAAIESPPELDEVVDPIGGAGEGDGSGDRSGRFVGRHNRHHNRHSMRQNSELNRVLSSLRQSLEAATPPPPPPSMGDMLSALASAFSS